MPIKEMSPITDYHPEYERSSGSNKNPNHVNLNTDKGSLIHPSFPPMGVVHPSYLGSQTNNVTPRIENSNVDREESIDQETYTKMLLNKAAQ